TGRFYQGIHERITDIASDLLFFTLKLNLIEQAEMEAKLKAPTLARYSPWVENSRAVGPHHLCEEMERVVNDRHVVGRAAWVRLFDETMASLRFPYRGRDLTNAEILHLLSDRDRDVRRDAARSLGRVLENNER